MAELIRVPSEAGGSLTVEVDARDVGVVKAARPGQVVAEATQTLEAALASLVPRGHRGGQQAPGRQAVRGLPQLRDQADSRGAPSSPGPRGSATSPSPCAGRKTAPKRDPPTRDSIIMYQVRFFPGGGCPPST